MSANAQLRLASVCAAAYGALAVSGVIHHFHRTGSLGVLLRGLASADLWIVLVVAGLVAWGLWQRYAWAWWLGLAAAGYQLFRIVSGYVQSPVFGHVPRPSVLLSVTLLLLIVVLLLQRKARLGANR